MSILRATIALLLLLVVSQQASAIADSESVRESVLCDADAPMPLIAGSDSTVGLNPHRITLLNWNVHKANDPALGADLEQLSNQADLVLLQEAVLKNALDSDPGADIDPTQLPFRFAAFAKGYSTAALVSGVMTLSTNEASHHCAFIHVEPWLRSPKATSIAWFELQDTAQSLLVINLHAVNFTVGSEDFETQLQASADLIAAHAGPVVFAGDFNTWNEGRKAALLETSNSLGLQAVGFEDDQRIRVLGYALDHVLVRGLHVIESRALAITSSDHNPLLVTLAVEYPRRAAPE